MAIRQVKTISEKYEDDFDRKLSQVIIDMQRHNLKIDIHFRVGNEGGHFESPIYVALVTGKD